MPDTCPQHSPKFPIHNFSKTATGSQYSPKLSFGKFRMAAIAILLVAWTGGLMAPSLAASNNAVPHIDMVNPVSVNPGATGVTLTVLGTGFVSASVVKWNSSALTTTFVSSRELTASVPNAFVAAMTLGSITVVSPTPGGGTSNAFYLPVAPSAASALFPSTPSSSSSVGTASRGVVAADLNGDGKMDLAVANEQSDNVTILLGNGDGTFTTKSNPAAGAAANWIAVGDFNEDGIPDLAVANLLSSGAGGVSILLGNGDGTFTAAASLTAGNQPWSVTTADFNGDGHMDLAVANASGESITVFLGHGDGTFGTGLTTATGGVAIAIVSGDFNEDGIPDVAVTLELNGTVSIFLGNGDGTFGAAQYFSTGGSGTPIGLVVADFNKDNHLDLAAMNRSDVSILLGNGAGSFTLHGNLATGSSNVYAGVAADYNGDGNTDLVVNDLNGGKVYLFLGLGNGNFGSPTQYLISTYTFAVATADFNGDGALDLAVTNFTEYVDVLLQGTPVSVAPTSLPFGNQTVGVTSSAETVTLTNNSDSTVTISSASLSGSNAGDFSVSGGTCVSGPSVTNGTTCTVTLTFTPTTAGARAATLSITDSAGDSPQTVSITGTGVALAPTIQKAFGAATIPLNGSTTLSFMVTNPSGNTIALTGIGFMDALPSGLTVATPNGLTGSCGSGTITATAGASSLNLSGATLSAATSCTFEVNVKGTSAGAQANTTGVATSNESGAGATSNTATVTVVSPATISKIFGAASVALHGSTTLTFMLSNPNSGTTLTGVNFTDTFPSGLAVSSPNGLSGTCGGGSISASAGSASVALSGATLAASGSCTFSVNVTGTAAGAQDNVLAGAGSNEGGTGTGTSASIVVVAAPSIAKAFGATSVAVGGTTSLTFTITNPSSNAGALNGVAFTDALPAGIAVATPNGLANSCGGTVTATAGSASVSLTGATLAASSSCVLSVNVTGTAGGAVTNTTGAVSSTNGGTGNTATANLTVGTVAAITSANSATFTVGTAGSFTITTTGMPTPSITETGALPSGLTFSDNGNGTATLSGTPAASGTAGAHVITVTAHNGVGANGVQTLTITVGKGTPVVTWATPSAISYGTALSGTQLDATANVAGTFVYSPASGTVLAAGSQSLTTTFTPTDTADFTNANGNVTLTVNKATPAITWATPSAITYGTALSGTQLDASTSVAGTFVYSPASGAVLAPGSQSLTTTFTPTDTADFTNANGNVTLTVNKATPAITWATPSAISYGTALSGTQLDASTSTAGTFVYSPASGAVLNAGAQNLSTTFTPTDTMDDATGTSQVTLTVNPAGTTSGLASSATPANIGTSVTFTATVISGAGTPPGSVTFLDGGTTLGVVTLTAGAAAFSTTSLALGTHTIGAAYSGSGNFAASNAPAITQTIVAPQFIMGVGTPNWEVHAGETAIIPMTVTPTDGFRGTVDFAISGVPAKSTSAFSPTTLTVGSGAATDVLTIITTAPSNTLASGVDFPSRMMLAGSWWFPLGGLALIGTGFARRRRNRAGVWAGVCATLLVVFACAGILAGCANDPTYKYAGTPKGHYLVTVTATAVGAPGTAPQTTTVTLIVK